MSGLVDVENVINNLITFSLDYSTKLVGALITLFIGIWVIKLLKKFVHNIIEKNDVDPTVTGFVTSILSWGLRIMLFIAVITKLGVQTSSFIAVLGAIGLAVGMSLQGSLSNISGGILIVMFKPFKVGDTIEAQGVQGTVMSIQIFNTQINSGNNQVIFIPNGILSNGTVINYSREANRRADLKINLSYDADLKKAKEIVEDIFNSIDLILDIPAPSVSLDSLGESSMVLSVKAWAKNENHSDMTSKLLEAIKFRFDQEGIEISKPQKDFILKQLNT